MSNSDLKDFFLLVSQETTDSIWRSLFEGIAEGNMPLHFEIREGYMIYRYARKYKSIEIPGDVHQAFVLMRDFVLRNAGAISAQDARVENPSKPLSWRRVRNNGKMLSEYVIVYATTVCQAMKLSNIHVDRLYLFIISSIRCGHIGDVKIANNKIVEVPYLSFDAQNQKFFLTKKLSSAVRKSVPAKKSCNTRWKNMSSDMALYAADISIYLQKTNKKPIQPQAPQQAETKFVFNTPNPPL